MTTQILETQATEILELTDEALMAVDGGIAFIPFLIAAGATAGKGALGGAATYGGYKAGEAIFG